MLHVHLPNMEASSKIHPNFAKDQKQIIRDTWILVKLEIKNV